MAQTTVTLSYTNNVDISIPSNATNLQLNVGAGAGGFGGADGGTAGGGNGVGRAGNISLRPNFVARNLAIRPGDAGGNGTGGFSSSQRGFGGAGGAAGAAAGGRGQDQRATDWSGGGGGGGGATGVYDSFYNTWICVAGGGGGGGGGSLNRPGGAGGNAGGWGASGGFGPSNGDGFAGGFGGGDGGGGGGGGAGAPGGGRGAAGGDRGATATGGAGGGSLYFSTGATLNNGGNNGGNGFVTVQYTVVTPTIDSFTASPNPQTSGVDGTPNYDTFLSWSTTDAQTVTLSTVGTVAADGGITVTNLPQSTAGVTSPATRTYTLTATTGPSTVSRTITVSAFNDNNPPAFTIPNQTNLEPNQPYIYNIGQISSSVIDMVTRVTGLNGATVSRNNTNTWSTTIVISPNDTVQVRFFSLGFNQSPNGLTNTTTTPYGVTIGTQTAFFNATTRAPDVNETFNLPNESDYVPYPDIDTIPDPDIDIRNQSNPYISSNTLTIDDIELGNPSGVEIRTNNGNAQVRKKITGTTTWGPWQDVRSI